MYEISLIADLSFSQANIEFLSSQKGKGFVVVVDVVVVDVVDVVLADVVDVVVVDVVVVDVVVADEIVVDVVDVNFLVVVDNLVVEVYNLKTGYNKIAQIINGWSEAESFSI